MESEKNNLIHNIAGELASKYVFYLSKHYIGNNHNKYFYQNWKSEYNSRVKIMIEDSEMIDKLNGYNDFYNCNINQNGKIKKQF